MVYPTQGRLHIKLRLTFKIFYPYCSYQNYRRHEIPESHDLEVPVDWGLTFGSIFSEEALPVRPQNDK